MRAVVLAAGLGTRLGSLTAERPKAAVLVGGRPIVAHVVAHLIRCGFDEVAVNLSYRPDQVRAALAGASARVSWFEERELLGTAGALSQMVGFLRSERAFLVHYGDVLTDHDLGAMLTKHLQRGALLTMLVHQRESSNSVVRVDSDWRVQEFLERPTAAARARIDSPWVNSGIYALSPRLLECIPAPPSDVARDLLPLALRSGPVYAEPLSGFRCAIDSNARIREAELALSTNRWQPAP
jgi:mannose-1-phosphate guanylyltransferase